MSAAPLLAAQGVAVTFRHGGRAHLALSGVSLTLHAGEALGIVGESGSGKSTLARALVGLQRLSAGSIVWRGEQPLNAGQAPNPARIARHAQFVFQDPSSSLNPRLPTWRLVTEPAMLLGKLGSAECRALAADLLGRTGLPTSLIDRFPHQMSGGQRQRLAIARALSTSPSALILDEPTSALDMSVQAAILNELLALNQSGITLVLISHDLAVVRHLCSTICVMREGAIVDQGPGERVIAAPGHPYAQELIAAADLRDFLGRN